ncbi:hypothetical protein [Aureivirga sp. CE67]|uniref:hypothetical protein n=1 Tax=Aureivirga sp. CE67 TaxID=1788983 RepID=UPI0018C966A5|nr:hypothetical protein [Aureivirga sp. CE67]
MNRVIVDYKKLNKDILNLLIEKYPDGYSYDDILSFQNSKNETVKVVEVRTNDTIYLVKISLELEQTMEDFVDNDFEFDEFDS